MVPESVKLGEGHPISGQARWGRIVHEGNAVIQSTLGWQSHRESGREDVSKLCEEAAHLRIGVRGRPLGGWRVEGGGGSVAVEGCHVREEQLLTEAL